MDEREKRLDFMKWTGRIISILIGLFLVLMSFDTPVFTLGFFMHLIPAFLVFGALGVAWKYEVIGGWIFVLLGLISVFFFSTYEDVVTFLIVSMPLFAVGVLFLFCGFYEVD